MKKKNQSKTKKPEAVSSLKPASYNPRKITPKKLDDLGKSMKEFGDLSGIIKNIRTGNLIGGHQRLKHFDPEWSITKRKHTDDTGTVAVGEIDSPFGIWAYREVDWPEDREKTANIAANKHGGEFDMSALKSLVFELKDSDTDIKLTGFDDGEFEKLITSEKEWKEAGNLGDSFTKAVTSKIKRITENHPRELNKAMAVIVNNGRGNAVLFLSDPNTADIIQELKRYADSGEDSPLECLVRALIEKGV